MTIERAAIQAFVKPWGSAALLPWSRATSDGLIGEIWFNRGDPAQDTALLLKLLFTTQPLSIQVHPDDAMARSLGLSRGKTEAWYVLSAKSDARVARGLAAPQTEGTLRAAIADGSIVELVRWQAVQAGDVVPIPAGTIHALGAGLVVAELQQRSDTTYRLFDFERGRDLHIERGVAASILDPAPSAQPPRPLSAVRTVLVACPHFVLERLVLPPGSLWELAAPTETWLLVIEGSVTIGTLDLGIGEAVVLDRDHASLRPGQGGATLLAGILASEPGTGLLRELSSSSPEKADA